MNSRKLNEVPSGKLRPVKLAHVVLRVADLKRSRDWYLTLLQGSPAFENEMLCFLTYDEEHHRIGLLALPGLAAPAAQSTGLEHIAFTYSDLPSLLANYQRLARLGIAPYWTINHGPTISMYYRDPDGHRIELQHDVFATAEEVNSFFASGAYEENFMGVVFDPEQMIAQYEAGTDIAELVRRPRLPAGTTPWDMHRP